MYGHGSSFESLRTTGGAVSGTGAFALPNPATARHGNGQTFLASGRWRSRLCAPQHRTVLGPRLKRPLISNTSQPPRHLELRIAAALIGTTNWSCGVFLLRQPDVAPACRPAI